MKFRDTKISEETMSKFNTGSPLPFSLKACENSEQGSLLNKCYFGDTEIPVQAFDGSKGRITKLKFYEALDTKPVLESLHFFTYEAAWDCMT